MLCKAIITILCHFLTCIANAQQERTHTVYFDFNKFTLTETETLRLLNVSGDSLLIISISGHTDPIGTTQANYRLSVRRAETVQQALQAQNTDYSQALLKAYGEDSLLSRNDSLNRRVEIRYRIRSIPSNVPNNIPVDTTATASLPGDTQKTVLTRQNFERIYFLPDQAVIDPASYQHVAALLRFVQAYPDQLIEIRGHVNMSRRFNRFPENGFYQRMEKLSEDRARLIYEILVEKGIEPGRLRYRGMGNREMVVPDARSEAEMRRNMRVEVVVFE